MNQPTLTKEWLNIVHNEINNSNTSEEILKHTSMYHNVKYSVQRWYTANEINNMLKEGLEKYNRRV